MKTVVVIPSRNEAKFIKPVVERLIKQGLTVIVSDDDSTDNTIDCASRAGAMVVKSGSKKHGYGHTLKVGIDVAIKEYHPDILVFMDGDGQHSPRDINGLLFPLMSDTADVVLGNRFHLPGYKPFYRKLGIQLCTWVANLGSKHKVEDVSTGYWAIKTRCLPTITEMGWGATFELLVKVRAAKYRIASVPIKPIRHKHSRDNSTANVFVLGTIVLWKIIKWRFLCEILRK
jgi:glycosyltransferase involved in cell wall biosynthesis